MTRPESTTSGGASGRPPARRARSRTTIPTTGEPSETAQQIDPLSGITARIFVCVVAVVSLALAVILTLSNSSEVSSLPLQLVAMALLVAGYAYFIWAADPYRRRVSRRDFAIALTFLLLAALTESLSQLGTDVLARNDWGPLCVALLLMVGGSYRTPGDLIGFTAISLAVVAVSTALNLSTFTNRSALISFTITGSPVLALGGGAALYAGYLIAGLKRERAVAAEAREARELTDRREVIEEFVGSSTATLRRDVLPFFRQIKAQDALAPADIERAAELSESLRASLAAASRAEPLADLVGVFHDPHGLSHRLTEQQRAALRTLLVFLGDQPAVPRDALTLSLTLSGVIAGGVIEADSGSTDRTLGSRVSPFIGLMQLAFATAEESNSGGRFSVSFTI